jgi:hypothetical protein
MSEMAIFQQVSGLFSHRSDRSHWCWLQLGDAAIMLQEFLPNAGGRNRLGLKRRQFHVRRRRALYREFKSHGTQVRKRLCVGNLWVVLLTDPGRDRIEFESPTDAPEESEWTIC